MFAKVVVPLPLPPLTYLIPPEMELKKGDFVYTKVRKKIFPALVTDVFSELSPEDQKFTIKPLEDRLPLQLDTTIVDFLLWAADYYFFPAGEVLKYFLPENLQEKMEVVYEISPAGKEVLQSGKKLGRAQKELLSRLAESDTPLALPTKERPTAKKLLSALLIRATERATDNLAGMASAIATVAPNLNSWQANAAEKIREGIKRNNFHSTLLQGVTGSGKTEVYLESARTALDQGKNVLVLVPEISLTPQLVDRFRKRLGLPIAVLHSGMTDSDRTRHWHLLQKNLVRVCIGVRSAIFAPISNLGLIVVDEEHDGALKQEDRFRYHARDLALVRGKLSACSVVLGSATPSLESFFNVKKGKLDHLLLPERATAHSLPQVSVIDQRKSMVTTLLSYQLKQAIQGALEKREQVMLLLNRRGFSSFLICLSCGDVPNCPNCSVSLTYYKTQRRLKCHYCDYSLPAKLQCGKCGDGELKPNIEGTEALEEEVHTLFPTARVLRMDRENMSKRGAIETALGQMQSHEVDILIGTQMIAKGHDFPSVSVVGLVNTDSSLHLPDFRSAERCFQLFTQMAGRAGRGQIEGKVFLQTLQPEHPSIRYAIEHDYLGFVEQELVAREQFQYPPYSRLARILLSSTDPKEVEQFAETIADWFQRYAPKTISVLGPSPAVLSKILNRYRWSILLKCTQSQALHGLLRTFQTELHKQKQKKVVVQIDMDPLSLL